jgi:sterol desaturase/sphingolipid hydroxylase (fatty acid hydroxylase superfamily)
VRRLLDHKAKTVGAIALFHLPALASHLAGHLAVVYVAGCAIFGAIELLLERASAPAAGAPGRMLVNFGLPLALIPMGLVLPFGMISAAGWAQGAHVGLFNSMGAPWPAMLAVAVLTRTGLGYGLHRASHVVPWLWRLHKVHHSDRCVDVSLALRHHPLETLPALLVFSAGAVALGLPPWSLALTESVLIVGGYTDHMNVSLPPRLGRWLLLVFCTPDFHRVHHSAERDETDSNYGSLFTVWDQLFGTYRAPGPVAQFGLHEVDETSSNSFTAQLLLPFSPGGRPALAPVSPPASVVTAGDGGAP